MSCWGSRARSCTKRLRAWPTCTSKLRHLSWARCAALGCVGPPAARLLWVCPVAYAAARLLGSHTFRLPASRFLEPAQDTRKEGLPWI